MHQPPGTNPVKLPLRKSVGQQRQIDAVPWMKPSPLIVALRKGQPTTPQLGFLAGQYRGESRPMFVLDIYEDDALSAYIEEEHHQIYCGFGFAEIAGGKLKLRYRGDQPALRGSSSLAQILAEINSLIREHLAEPTQSWSRCSRN